MKLQSLMLRNSLLILTSLLALPAFRAAAQSNPDAAGTAAVQAATTPARITQAIDETQLVRLRGNVHPLARPEFDRGPVSDATPMKRMMLVLQRSPEQQAALSQFMDEQMSKDSPNFHKWLTPDEFGKLYGPVGADTQTVTGWLASHGFTAMRVNRGKTAIEFSGNVGQVRSAFHTDIHKFVVNGEERQANVSDPQIPAALTPVVTGVVSLHNFPMQSAHHVLGQFRRTADGRIEPLFTGGNPPFYALGPADFAKIYNIPSSLTGMGGNIAIIGFSTINVQDVSQFRALFNLPVNNPVVVNNGPDPGFNGEEGEADLDVQWSGAVAPNATIHYVNSEGTLTSDGVTLGAEYVVDNNSDDVMSLSFNVCEANFGTGNAFFNALWEQAAAQGITVTVAAGDAGSANCDDFNAPIPASHGIAVNGLASTPFNIAVGGTDFDDANNQPAFWSPANAPLTRESALGYIPEVPWNSSCAATATSSNLTTCVSPPPNLQNILAGSGGPSTLYAKPSFQSGITPNGIAATDTNHRYLPDVSLFAAVNSPSNSFYVICEADAILPPPPSCVPDANQNFQFLGIGGTSASAPSFAGIIALIGQSEATAGRSRRQGNANFVLYKIAQTASSSCNSSSRTNPLLPAPAGCVFNDVTKGNNSVPCTGGTPNCSSTSASAVGVLVTTVGTATTPAFSTTAGTGSIPSYDLATGLGTVNVANLATAWGTAAGAFKATTTTLKINGSSTPATITHGTPVMAAVTVAVVSPATGIPTGNFSILPALSTVNGGAASNTGTLSAGTATINGVLLPGGSPLSVTTHYAGDGTFASSDSAAIPITVNPENSRLQMEIVTFDPISGLVNNTNAATFAYGSPYILRMDVLDHTANPCVLGGTVTGCAFDATGTITLTDNGAPLDGGSFKLNSEGHAEDQPIQLTGGTHALSATYSGDVSYNPPTAAATDNVTVTKAITTTGTVPSSSTVTSGTPMTLTANISSQSNSAAGPGGTVQFLDGTTQIGSPATVAPFGAFFCAPPAFACAGGTAALQWTFSTQGSHSVTATYSGDTNYATSTASAITIMVTSPGSFTIGGGNATVTAGASSTSTITLTPTGGFNGSVNVTCPTAGLPPGVTCSPNPLVVTVPTTGANGTGSLTISVAAPSTALSASAAPARPTLFAAGTIPPSTGKGWWALSAGTGLAAMFLLFLPGRKRYRAALGLGLICVLSLALGCNGGGYSPPPPAATTTKITVTSTKVASGTNIAFSITVTPYGTATVNGSVQLFDGATALGSAVTLSGGSASINNASFVPGVHPISAKYTPSDTSTLPSASGTLNIAITGNTTFAVTASPAASNGSPTVNLTIN
jgi:subtilase family serine protease